MANLENLTGTLLLFASIGLFLGAIGFFILPLFIGKGLVWKKKKRKYQKK